MKLIEAENLLKKFKLREFPDPEYIKLKHPVLLCHGYGGITALTQPSPLYSVCRLLRHHGVTAFAPNIVSYAKIETRAPQWIQRIETLVDRYDIEKLNIIAHSMGGLDIRHALTMSDLTDRVASVTTISTPHHGTSLAEFVLRAPDTLRDNLSAFFDWFGNTILPDAQSDSIGAVRQLTREYLSETFNPSHPLPEELPCFSFSASVGKGADTPINAIFKYQNSLIYENEGPNDGYVSEKSSRWGTHIKTAHLSHLEQMYMQVRKAREPDVESFWLDVVKNLAENGL